MASRSKTDLKREAMKDTLRTRCRSGELQGSRPLPGLRELASEFQLSKDGAAMVLRELVEEGLLYTLPRVGTFVRELQAQRSEVFVLVSHVSPDAPYDNQSLKRGFEDAVISFGATPLVMAGEALEAAYKSGDLGQLAGVFDMATEANGQPFWKSRFPHEDRACVRIGDALDFAPGYDLVAFDNFGGGARATRHLMERGHRKIAFLGVHDPSHPHPHLLWSSERERGYRETMRSEGLETDLLVFHPGTWPSQQAVGQIDGVEEALARQIWPQLKNRSDITAFVAANDHLAISVLEHLKANWPVSQWPAVIGFDKEESGRDHLLTSLRLPWDELGRVAGEMLWARYHNELPRASQMRRVSMKLIPRLSCLSNSLRLSHSRLITANV